MSITITIPLGLRQAPGKLRNNAITPAQITRILRSLGTLLVGQSKLTFAVHELTHRLQRVKRDLDDYFQALHVERTAGDPLKSLRKFDKRYEAIEKTREDEYANPYRGKEYPDSATRAGALELMPMTMQYLLGSSRTFGWIADDKELFKLAIGLLFHYVP